MAYNSAGKSLKEMHEDRAKLVNQAQAYHSQNEASWSTENEVAFKAMMSDASDCKAAIGRKQQLLDAAAESGNYDVVEGGQPSTFDKSGVKNKILVRDGRDASGAPRYKEVETKERGSAEYADAFTQYISTGSPRRPLQQAISDSTGISKYAALQSDDARQAGYLVASEQFAAGIIKEIDDLLYIRRRAKIHVVREAGSLGIRRRTNRMNTFRWGSELGAPTPDSALAYGGKILTPHYMTGSIKVSRDLLRRSVVSVEGEVTSEGARNAGELQEDAFMYGTGDRQPLGVFVPSNDGISTARDIVCGTATNFTADGLLGAKYALKKGYRNGSRGAVSWLFSRGGIERIAKLKDSNGQYMLRVGMGMVKDAANPEDFLLDYPVDESERAPNTFTAGLYVGILANWQNYEIADALDMEIQVLYELNARTNEVEYIMRMKTDAMPTLEEAFVRLQLAAS